MGTGKWDPDEVGAEIGGYTALIEDYPEYKDIKWVYANGWYDGPLDGMVRHHGVLYYAQIVWENEDDSRVYSLRMLDAESQKYEDEKHEDFCRWVGSHWTFEDCGHDEGLKPQSEWHHFYDKYDWKDRRKMTGEIVGWFTG